MNATLISANVLVFITFIIHTFMGDKEYMHLEPDQTQETRFRVYWSMGRGAFHIVSADFLLATVLLGLVNFSNFFQDKTLILKLLSLYFLMYGVGFFLALAVSKKFPKIFIIMWQWILMLVISGLIYLGIES
ncbi:hypothetical protein AD998_16170 [bacterium 336/3]|nr:hypothetical protein AD998_16170 [bacterium 336/3]